MTFPTADGARAQATCIDGSLEAIAEGNLGAGVLGIPNDTVFIGVQRLLTNFDLEVGVIALRPTANQVEVGRIVAAHVVMSIDTSTECPVIIDVSDRLETEDPVILIDFRLAAVVVVVGTVALVGVLNLAEHLEFVGILLEFGDANAEVRQLLAELSCETVESCAIGALRILRKCLCNHLRHLITGDVAIAEVGSVAVTFNNTFGCELRHCVICPVPCRNVAERICRRERRRCRTNDHCRCQRCCC